jgi:hypothetical protein
MFKGRLRFGLGISVGLGSGWKRHAHYLLPSSHHLLPSSHRALCSHLLIALKSCNVRRLALHDFGRQIAFTDAAGTAPRNCWTSANVQDLEVGRTYLVVSRQKRYLASLFVSCAAQKTLVEPEPGELQVWLVPAVGFVFDGLYIMSVGNMSFFYPAEDVQW